jgi:hypothetical protein
VAFWATVVVVAVLVGYSSRDSGVWNEGSNRNKTIHRFRKFSQIRDGGRRGLEIVRWTFAQNLAPLGLHGFVADGTQGFAALRPGLLDPAPLGLFLCDRPQGS